MTEMILALYRLFHSTVSHPNTYTAYCLVRPFCNLNRCAFEWNYTSETRPNSVKFLTRLNVVCNVQSWIS